MSFYNFIYIFILVFIFVHNFNCSGKRFSEKSIYDRSKIVRLYFVAYRANILFRCLRMVSNDRVICSVLVDLTAATMSILVIFAALGEMICPVVVGNVSRVSALCLNNRHAHRFCLVSFCIKRR